MVALVKQKNNPRIGFPNCRACPAVAPTTRPKRGFFPRAEK